MRMRNWRPPQGNDEGSMRDDDIWVCQSGKFGENLHQPSNLEVPCV